jgi:starch phosphorylase
MMMSRSLSAEAPEGFEDQLARNLWLTWQPGGAQEPNSQNLEALRMYLAADDAWFTQRHPGASDLRVAYFSAEFAVAEALRIYAGGLGVLAGDHLKSASDLGVPLVGVGLFYREGYFTQRVDRQGVQLQLYEPSDPRQLPLTLERAASGNPLLIELPYLGHRLYAQIWRADVGRIPLYLLDTDVAANRPEDRRITDRLYGGDSEHRLRQEMVLGIGGMRALVRLGITPTVLHLNEGHAAFAAVERVRQAIGDQHGVFRDAAERLREGVVFTTHTPVPAGHDEFTPALMERYLGGYIWEMREPWDRFLALGRHETHTPGQPFNMTLLAMRLSGRRNGVSRLHGEVSRHMWRALWPDLPEQDVPIAHVTNGVHLATWVAPPMAALYTQSIGPEWMQETDELHWQRAAHIPLDSLWAVRSEQRRALVDRVRTTLAAQARRRGEDPVEAANALDPQALTIVFARRFATYKRATLLLSLRERLSELLAGQPIQFIFAGKAHPRDEPGQELLREVFAYTREAEAQGSFVFLEEYDLDLAKQLVSGADVWLNVPRRPREASGTSGMKAAANGALNLSILDGWWAEAWTDHNHLTHPIGWAIHAEDDGHEGEDACDARAVYELLEKEVVPTFYDRNEAGIPLAWCERVRANLRHVVPFFSTHRMVAEYVEELYLPSHSHGGRVRLAVTSLEGVG